MFIIILFVVFGSLKVLTKKHNARMLLTLSIHILYASVLPLCLSLSVRIGERSIHTWPIYSRRQYKVSVTYRLPTVPYLKKMPSKTVPFYSTGRDAILLLYTIRI